MMHLHYKNPVAFERGCECWGAHTFKLIEPIIYTEDLSFDWAGRGQEGTEHAEALEVSDVAFTGASVTYTVYAVDRHRGALPTPPPLLTFAVQWEQMEGEDYIPALPACVDLTCSMELMSFTMKVLKGAVVCYAEYAYTYSIAE